MTVVTFLDYTPLARYPPIITPWVDARIEEATDASGPWTTIDTITLDPVDDDPTAPLSRDFSTDQATLDEGWYRVVFVDAAAVEETTDPVHYPHDDTDLTTLTAVRAFLQKNDSSNTTQDGIITSLITRASRQINREIAQFKPVETDTAHTFIWRGGPLGLHPYFLRAATAVSRDSETLSPTTVEAVDYRLRPKPSPDGVYRWIAFPSTMPFSAVEREVTITGDWGFVTVPDDVEHWTIVTVATWLRRDVSSFSSTLRLDEDRLERPDSLPSAVTRGLACYMTPRGI